MAKIGGDILFAERLLKAGELVSIPTETVYGLAGNALDEEAILKIYSAKNRPKFDPLIAHTDSLTKIENWVVEIPYKARALADAFWPGPLTMLLDKKPVLPDLLTSGLSRAAFRIPNHAMTLKLLQQLDFPLAAPSANPFGFVSPTSAQHVNDQLGEKIQYILDGGTCDVGIESTIVGFDNGQVVIYRLGGLGIEEIEQVCGKVHIQLNRSSNPVAPGMLKSHYSPGKPVIIGNIASELKKNQGKRVGVISYNTAYSADLSIVLSLNSDMKEAAKNVFRALREMNKAAIDLIITETFPNEGLGRAINDRLTRAAAQ